jgi:hypothetical protein
MPLTESSYTPESILIRPFFCTSVALEIKVISPSLKPSMSLSKIKVIRVVVSSAEPLAVKPVNETAITEVTDTIARLFDFRSISELLSPHFETEPYPFPWGLENNSLGTPLFINSSFKKIALFSDSSSGLISFSKNAA